MKIMRHFENYLEVKPLAESVCCFLVAKCDADQTWKPGEAQVALGVSEARRLAEQLRLFVRDATPKEAADGL